MVEIREDPIYEKIRILKEMLEKVKFALQPKYNISSVIQNDIYSIFADINKVEKIEQTHWLTRKRYMVITYIKIGDIIIQEGSSIHINTTNTNKVIEVAELIEKEANLKVIIWYKEK